MTKKSPATSEAEDATPPEPDFATPPLAEVSPDPADATSDPDDATADPADAAPAAEGETADPAAALTDPDAPLTDPDAPPADASGLLTDAASPALGAFPAGELALGHSARRVAWAPGYELVAVAASGRSGGQRRLMTTGSRSGMLEWKPRHLADELMAQDWIVIPAVELIP